MLNSFFSKADQLPFKTDEAYKIYNDGGHYVATKYYRSPFTHIGNAKEYTDIDIAFDSLYATAMKNGLKDGKSEKPLTEFIRSELALLFSDYPDLDGFIADKLRRKRHNLAVRKKRFRRKAYLNKWNYFITLTYDDKKQTAETFRAKLRKCLSNLHTRRGWRYMGVFECAPDTGRLHFHALLYVPENEMVGNIVATRDYSTAQGKMQIAHINDFFAERFGRNDFEEVSESELRHGYTLDYILKYIGKTNERIVYSRGIATEVYKRLTDNDIVTDYVDYVTKYVLFDDVIDWTEDVLRLKNYRQMTIVDLFCNPPQAG